MYLIPVSKIRELVKTIQCYDNSNNESCTAGYLTPYAEDKSNQIFKRINEYDVTRLSDTSWLVSHKSNRNIASLHSDETILQDEYSMTRPFEFDRFKNTHEVLLCRNTGRMRCSCATAIRIGMPCPHIGAIVRRKHLCMFSHRWFTIYNSIVYGSDPKITKSFETMKIEEEKYKGMVNINGVIEDIPVFRDIDSSIKNCGHNQSKQMLLAYCMHKDEKVVLKSNILDWSSMTKANEELYSHIKVYLMNDIDTISTAVLDIDNSFSIDSQEQILGQSPNHHQRTVPIQNDIKRYHLLSEKMQRIQKLCEGRDEVYTKVIEMMNNIEIEAMSIIQKTDVSVQQDMALNQMASIVSSNAPVECTPNRGRYKSSYEMRK